MEYDLAKIQEYWFVQPLRYRFGASVALNEQSYAVTVISNPWFVIPKQ